MKFQGPGLYFFIGHKGNIVSSGHLFDFDEIKQSVCEVNLEDFFKFQIESTNVRGNELIYSNLDAERDIRAFAQEEYKRFGKYGHHFDFIVIDYFVVNRVGVVKLDFIGELADLKPTLAADLVLFIRDKTKHLYFAGLYRRYEPGAGKIALVGGMQDIVGIELEDSLTTVLRESDEEIGLKTKRLSNIKGPFPQAASIMVKLRLNKAIEKKIFTSIDRVGSFHTASSEINESTGRKRVYLTTAYRIVIDIDEELTVEQIEKMFSADAKETKGLFVGSIINGYFYLKFLERFEKNSKEEIETEIDFGIEHHQEIFKLALRQLAINDVNSGLHRK